MKSLHCSIKLGFSLVLVLLASASWAGDLEKGKMIPRVECGTDSKYSYALYLPGSYTPDKKWPVLFCFDPAARGHIPVRLLTGTAERYGYIVVGSNDSMNGPWKDQVKAQETLWKEINGRFPVDPARSYAVGFSGGSRAGLRLALEQRDHFAGVLSCGAFYDERGKVPKDTSLALYMVAGTEDFNLFELTRAHKELAGWGVLNWLEVFDGTHDWPSSKLLAEGVEFFEAAAMKRGQIPKQQKFLDALAKRRTASAGRLEKAGLKVPAYRKYLQTAELYPSTPAAEDAAARAAVLAKDPDVVGFFELEETFWDLHMRLTTSPDTKSLEATLNELRKMADGDGPGAGPASQLLKLGSVQLSQLGYDALSQGHYREAAYCFETAYSLEPGNSTSAYNLACALARLGEKKKAVEYLQKAVDNGFDNREHLEKDPDLKRLRREPGFKEILKSLE